MKYIVLFLTFIIAPNICMAEAEVKSVEMNSGMVGLFI